MEELIREEVSVGARMKFLALGSAACRTLDYFFSQNSSLIDLCLAVDTDLRCLESLNAGLPKYCFAQKEFRGLSTGGDENLVKKLLEKQDEALQNFLKNSDIIVILVGLSGGTGSGMILPLVQTAVQNGTFALVLPILPFSFEGTTKGIRAQTHLKALQSTADLVIPFYNDILFQTLPDSATIREAFQEGDRLICQLLCGFFNGLNTTQSGGFICNLTDFMQHFSGKPDSVFWGLGSYKGNNITQALKNTFDCPSLKTQIDHTLIQRAFVFIQGCAPVTLNDLKTLNNEILSFLGVPDLQILNSYCTSNEGTDETRLLLVFSACRKNLKSVHVRRKSNHKNTASQTQTQFDFEVLGMESYWDTPTYLRLGLKLDV